MKILFLSHAFYPAVGGIESISEILADAFVKQGHEVHLLTWTSETGKKAFEYKIIRNPNFFKLFKEYFWSDVVFENNPALRLAWPNLLFNRPSVIGLQTWISQADGAVGLQEQLKLKWLGRAKNVIACSEAIKIGCWPAATVIGNPYDEKTFKILSGAKRVRDFIFLGRLVSDKGADLAIKAFSKIVRNNSAFSEVTLTIVGDGPEKKQLERLVAELKLEKLATFKGSLRGTELVNCLNEHRFLLVPSIWKEPFGIVALEGMAAGCLPIVSDGGGLPDAVGKAGLIFKRGDVDSLVQTMKDVLQNSVLEQAIQDEAPSHLAAHTTKQVSEKYLAVIESAVSVQS